MFEFEVYKNVDGYKEIIDAVEVKDVADIIYLYWRSYCYTGWHSLVSPFEYMVVRRIRTTREREEDEPGVQDLKRNKLFYLN